MKCSHCNRGPLVQERDLNGKVQTICCMNCGHRIYREFTVRNPNAAEQNGRAGIAKPYMKERKHHV